MNKMKLGAIILVLLFIICSICVYTVPALRVGTFVKLYHEQIENALTVGHGVPADEAVILGYKAVNSWNAEHPMTEFVIMNVGGAYYGCYFSPDDVPLAFQNTDAILTSCGQDCWEWNGEGDNHGITSKISDRWYFFKAIF